MDFFFETRVKTPKSNSDSARFFRQSLYVSVLIKYISFGAYGRVYRRQLDYCCIYPYSRIPKRFLLFRLISFSGFYLWDLYEKWNSFRLLFDEVNITPVSGKLLRNRNMSLLFSNNSHFLFRGFLYRSLCIYCQNKLPGLSEWLNEWKSRQYRCESRKVFPYLDALRVT